MVKINSVGWGNVVVDGRKFDQVIIVGGEVFERDASKLDQLFGTTHRIGNEEVEKLISGNPEIIIIGTGQFGVLKVSDEVKEKLTRSGVEIKTFLAPAAVQEFNKQISQGKRVNALIHTTC